MRIYDEGYCPEVFSKIYSQYCEMSVISKSKLESEKIFGGSIDIFKKYELFIVVVVCNCDFKVIKK